MPVLRQLQGRLSESCLRFSCLAGCHCDVVVRLSLEDAAGALAGIGLVLAALATLGGLTVAGRLLDLPEDRQLLTQPPPLTTATQVVSVATLSPPATIPAVLQRPLRLPNLRRAGSCPTTPTAGPPMTVAHPVAAVAVGNGPVYPVLFRAAPDGQLDQSAVAYWDAPKPLAGVAIVRGHRLGTPRDRIRFQNDQQGLSLIHVLDRATAYSAGPEGRWWRPTRLRAGNGYYGLQIDGPQLQRGAGGQVRLALSFAHAGGVGFG
jgi:hypothetical protein